MTPTTGEIYAYNILRYEKRLDLQNDPNKYEKAADHWIAIGRQILEERGEPGLDLREEHKAAHKVVQARLAYEKAYSEAMSGRENWAGVANLLSAYRLHLDAYEELLAKDQEVEG